MRPFGVFGEVVFADAGFAVKAMQGGFGGDAHQVAVAFFVFG